MPFNPYVNPYETLPFRPSHYSTRSRFCQGGADGKITGTPPIRLIRPTPTHKNHKYHKYSSPPPPSIKHSNISDTYE